MGCVIVFVVELAGIVSPTTRPISNSDFMVTNIVKICINMNMYNFTCAKKNPLVLRFCTINLFNIYTKIDIHLTDQWQYIL